MNVMKYFDQINAHKYILLGAISEPSDNALKIVIEQASLGSNAVAEIVDDSIDVSGLREIKTTEVDCVYEIFFESYVGYSVMAESFALPNDEEIFQGRIFRIYEKSCYLDYLRKASFACDEYPGPIKHYGINCLNHVIEIASVEEPRVTLVRGGPLG